MPDKPSSTIFVLISLFHTSFAQILISHLQEIAMQFLFMQKINMNKQWGQLITPSKKVKFTYQIQLDQSFLQILIG